MFRFMRDTAIASGRSGTTAMSSTFKGSEKIGSLPSKNGGSARRVATVIRCTAVPFATAT